MDRDYWQHLQGVRRLMVKMEEGVARTEPQTVEREIELHRMVIDREELELEIKLLEIEESSRILNLRRTLLDVTKPGQYPIRVAVPGGETITFSPTITGNPIHSVWNYLSEIKYYATMAIQSERPILPPPENG